MLIRGSPALSDESEASLLAVALSTALPTHALGAAAAALLGRLRAVVHDNAAAAGARAWDGGASTGHDLAAAAERVGSG